jgi:outer membrane protein OmpA-like peptidoglycan-associated protein
VPRCGSSTRRRRCAPRKERRTPTTGCTSATWPRRGRDRVGGRRHHQDRAEHAAARQRGLGSAALLQKRDRELKAARAGTQTSDPNAEQARRAAETRAREAEAQAREAEAKAREAEQARRQASAAEQARAAEQAKAVALANELASLRAQQTGRGLVLTVGDVLFAPGKAEVSSGGQRRIDRLADFLRAYPKRNVLIEGHTDNTGDEDFNMKLSQQRADTVRDRLIEKGVAAQRIRTKGYGPKFPVVDNDTPGGRQQNRRVEVVVLEEGASAQGSSR